MRYKKMAQVKIRYKEKRNYEQYTHYIGKASIFPQATQAVNAWQGGQ
jgi:hypothetical protein